MIIGYAFTLVYIVALLMLIATVIRDRKTIYEFLRIKSKPLVVILLLSAIVAFFLIFALLYVHPAEQLYFDENIYQGIALNILMHGNALWCQYGTGLLRQCYANALYHDPVEWSFFLAIAFAIFGIGTSTAYATELLIGTISIIAIFLLVHVVFERDDIALISAMAIALAPQLFIWSRTQAVPDLPFMTFSIFAFMFFFIFLKKSNAKTLAPFLSMLILTVYIRNESILLILIFLLGYLFFALERDKDIPLRKKVKDIFNALDSNVYILIELTIFVILLFPQLTYLSSEMHSALNSSNYGNSSTQKAFSISNFIGTANMTGNAIININYLFGEYNSVFDYPVVFPQIITYAAILGAAFLAIDTRHKYHFTILGILLLWLLLYFIFYGIFYAGAATFGVDSRFMLQLTPALIILAAFGFVESADFITYLIMRFCKKYSTHLSVRLIKYVILTAFVLAFIVYPFTWYIRIITMPPSSMPQQSVIYPAITSFYAGYNSVPTNCLVFTFTPDIWYEFNRSAAQITYFPSGGQNFTLFASHYSCFVFDYGYWCDVPPNKNTTCQYKLQSYSHVPFYLNKTGTSKVAFYKLLNYTP